MKLKEMVRIATVMREEGSFLLDISGLTEKEAAFITVLVKDIAIYEFFKEVQELSIHKLVVACKYLEYKEALEKMEGQEKQDGIEVV